LNVLRIAFQEARSKLRGVGICNYWRRYGSVKKVARKIRRMVGG